MTATEEVVFAAFMRENHAGLTPLEKFGFILLSLAWIH